MVHPSPFRRLSARALTLAALLLVAYIVRETVWKRPPAPILTAPSRPADPRLLPPVDPLPGEVILKDYAQPGTRPEDDLSSMAHAFSNLTLLIKGDSPFRLGANEEFAAALRGKNRDQLRFLPDSHPCFNAQGQIVDRWQTPLFFHVSERSRIDLRSAGPDRQMWTEDDLHRRYNGEYRRGKELPPEGELQR
jgi:hypothetical protein